MEIRIHYSNTVKDMLAFQLSHAIRSPWHYVLFAGWSYVWLSPVTEEWSYWSCLSCTVKYYGIFSVIIVVSFLLLSMAPQFLRFLSKKHRASLGPKTISVSEAGVAEETDDSRSEYKWSAIQRVVRTERLVALYISPFLAHLVPRRAFDSNEAWQHFTRFVQEHAHNA
jgi:hypothetical protein